MIKHQKKTKGFTLVETILTIVIVSIISGVSAKILLSGLDTYSFVISRKDATQSARVAMERMVSELTTLTWVDLILIRNEKISFIDAQGFPTSFESDTMGGNPTLARGNDFLAGPLGFIDFDYLRADGSPASNGSQVDKINIELSITAAGGYGAITLRTEVYPRNRMYTNFR